MNAEPWSNEVEQAVLGAMLLDRDAARQAAKLIDGTAFYSERHRLMYLAMVALTERGDAIDPVTLRDELLRRGDLDRAGGIEYVGQLIDVVPTAAHIESHIRIMQDKAGRRQTIASANALIQAASNGSQPQDLATAADQLGLLARTLGNDFARKHFDPPLLARFATENPGVVPWVVRGYAGRGVVTLVAGHPKAGKTTLIAELAGAVSAGALFLGQETLGGSVLWVDLEQPRGLTARVLVEHSIAEAPIYVAWGTAPDFATAAEWCRERQIVLVVIDSLTKLYKAFGVEDENDPVQVERALQPLLDFGRSADVALLVIHHLRKSGGTEGLDVRGSGHIAAAVDIAITFRRFDPNAEVADARRVLDAWSRYEETPAKLVIERVDRRYRVCGTVAEVRRRAEREQVIGVLTNESRTADEIATMSNMAPSATRTVLKMLSTEPVQIRVVDRTGSGKKGDPYRYSKCLRAQQYVVGAPAFQRPSIPEDVGQTGGIADVPLSAGDAGYRVPLPGEEEK